MDVFFSLVWKIATKIALSEFFLFCSISNVKSTSYNLHLLDKNSRKSIFAKAQGLRQYSRLDSLLLVVHRSMKISV